MYKNILDKFDLEDLFSHLSKELNIDIDKVKDALNTPVNIPKEDIIIDDNNSKVIIYRKWLSTEDSLELFSYLKKNVKWEQKEISMYGKDVLQPRYIYFCSDDNIKHHNYSGKSFKTSPWIPCVKKILDKINKQFNYNLNSCLLNQYRDGSNYIGYHSDKEALGRLNVVVTLSLGGSRDFYMKEILEGNKLSKDTIETSLKKGDLVIMTGETQRHYKHSIPKSKTDNHRISLTFRQLSP
jgi:alkylated DNA repair dioxygenase AlkB